MGDARQPRPLVARPDPEERVQGDARDVVVLDEQDLETVRQRADFDILFLEGRRERQGQGRKGRDQKPGSFPHSGTSADNCPYYTIVRSRGMSSTQAWGGPMVGGVTPREESTCPEKVSGGDIPRRHLTERGRVRYKYPLARDYHEHIRDRIQLPEGDEERFVVPLSPQVSAGRPLYHPAPGLPRRQVRLQDGGHAEPAHGNFVHFRPP